MFVANINGADICHAIGNNPSDEKPTNPLFTSYPLKY
jgi:hypothetical protein